jgi:serine/threonine protein kinase
MTELSKKDLIKEGTILFRKFTVCEFIGDGLYSNAYKCIENHTQAIVCVKVFKNIDEVHMCKDEHKILSKLSHKNIIKVIGMDWVENTCALTTTYGGKTLFDMYRNNIEYNIKDALLQTINAINYLHHMKYVHMDIKSNNIVINPHNLVQLIDFNTAITGDSDIEVRYDYAQFSILFAPEILCGLYYTFPADIWAFGCLIYELYTKTFLFGHLKMTGGYEILLDIFKKIGVDDTNNINSLGKLPSQLCVEFKNPYDFAILDKNTVSLLKKIFIYNQKNRITAADIIKEDYFQ